MKIKISSEEVKALLAAIDCLIEIKILIRKVVPNYNLDDDLKKKFINLLNSLQSKLQPIFIKYLSTEQIIKKPPDQSENILEYIHEIIENRTHIIVSASSSKKRLKIIGADPRYVIVTGGPIFAENYRKVNPNLMDDALLNLKKKTENMVNQINKIADSEKEIIFLYEEDNLTDQIILIELESLENTLMKKVKRYNIKSWRFLENQ